MQAALVASERGHKVALFEEKKKVGGKMVYASIPKFKPEIDKLLSWYEKTLEKSPVEVKLGKRISSLDDLLKENPEVIVVAVGAEPLIPDIPGKDRENVLTVLDVFENQNLEIGKNIPYRSST